MNADSIFELWQLFAFHKTWPVPYLRSAVRPNLLAQGTAGPNDVLIFDQWEAYRQVEGTKEKHSVF